MFKFIAATVLTLACGLAFAATEINQAGQAQLESVKGIGPNMAGRILDARKTGPFADWADLRTRVKGVGESKAKKLSDEGMTVNGKAYTVGSSKPTQYRAIKPADGKAAAKADKAAR